MDQKTTYVVTDVQGNNPDIAGKRRKVGELIRLTENESTFELLRETIALPPEDKSEEPKAAPAKKS